MKRKSYLKSSLTDIPVLLIFMARPDQFGQVFEQVRIARPSKLFLYQDGPRKGRQDDIENIARCREIAENVDWNCQVFKMYQERNIGCDPSEYLAQKWMFEHVDRGIILEDDDVPSQSFFPFCSELLERYKDDNRINMICGMNHLEKYNSGNSYFFSTTASIWGWATWRRTIDQWDEHLSFLDDQNALRLVEENIGSNVFKHKYRKWLKHKNNPENKVYYESLVSSTQILNSQLNIVPSVNLIKNIGITADATHAQNSLKKMTKDHQKVFFIPTYEMKEPLSHPKYVLNDISYSKQVFDLLGWDSPWPKRLKRKIEAKIRRLLF